jgi:hypothetical protein
MQSLPLLLLLLLLRCLLLRCLLLVEVVRCSCLLLLMLLVG